MLLFSPNFSSANTCQDAGGQCKAESSCLGQIPEFNNVCQQENSNLVCCKNLIPQNDCVDNGGTCIDPNHQCLKKMEEYNYACSLNKVCCETPVFDECFENYGGTCTTQEKCLTDAGSASSGSCPDSSKPVCCSILNNANMCFANNGMCTNLACKKSLPAYNDECKNGLSCCQELVDSCGEIDGICELNSACENPLDNTTADTYCSMKNSLDHVCCKKDETVNKNDNISNKASESITKSDKKIVQATTANYSYSNPIGYNSITQFAEGLLASSQTLVSWLAVIFIVVGGILYITASGKESQITLAKNTILSALIGLALALAGPSLLKEIKEIIIPESAGAYDISTANNFVEILTNVMSFVLTIIVILAMMSLVYSGFLYLTSAGSRENIDTAKKIGKFSVLALVLSGSSIIIIRLILGFLNI